MKRIAVWAGGEPIVIDGARIGAVDMIVAADSGLDAALEFHGFVDVAVGDFDSVDPEVLACSEANGTEVQRHPPAKDATDLELAVDQALCMGADEVIVVGGAGGRLDHLLGNIALLTRPAYAMVKMSALCGAATVTVVRDEDRLVGTRGDLVSLLPVNGNATGVTTHGLLYPLRGETLQEGSTRGVSNELTGVSADVFVEAGVLLAVQPGEKGSHLADGVGLNLPTGI